MRRGSQGIVAKILIMLLVIPFVVWGVGDILRGSNKRVVATVGGDEISQSAYAAVLDDAIAQMRQYYGSSISVDFLVQSGMHQRLLDNLIDERLVQKHSKNLHLIVGDESIKDIIVSMTQFRAQDGSFDYDGFKSALRQSGINEKHYLDNIRTSISHDLLYNIINDKPAIANAVVDPLVAYENQERVVDLIKVTASDIPKPEDPTDTQLVQFYNEHSDEFKVNQLRDIRFISFSIEDLSKSVVISDEELEAQYQQRKDQYVVPESRTLVQYLYDDEASAQKTYDALTSGDDVKDGQELNNIKKEGLPDEVRDLVFSLTQEQPISEPVETVLGWHVFVLKSSTAQRFNSFDEVKEDLKQELLSYKQSDVFYQQLNDMEDLLASGANIDTVASAFELPITDPEAFDANGLNAKSEIIKELPEYSSSFVDVVFDSQEGVESSVTELEDGRTYVVIRVDEIIDERIKALDEAKGIATTLYKAYKRKQLLSEHASKLAAELKEGQADNNVKSVVSSYGVELVDEQTVKRAGGVLGSKSLPASMVQSIFSMDIGQVTDAYSLDDDTYVIANLVRVNDAKASDIASKRGQFSDNLADQQLNEIKLQYLNYLRTLYPVTKNEFIIEGVTSAFGGGA